MFTTLPRSSMSFTVSKAAMELASVATSPAAAVSLMPSSFPRDSRGLFKSRVMTYTKGKAPASTMAMAPTVSKPSEMGARPGMSRKPVRLSTMAATSPTVTMATTILPNTVKAVTMAFSARQSPRAMSAAMNTMGMRLRSTMAAGNPAVRPPARMPRGMATMPHRIPLAMAGRSSCRSRPMATGMVKTTVAPSMEPVRMPPRPAASGLKASSRAREAPPMSQARRVPANMAGSAPRNP